MRILRMLAMVGVLSVGVDSAKDAHTSYFGIGVAVFPAFGGVIPLGSVQAGTPIADFVELRATFDTLISLNILGADVLVTLKPGGGFKPYAGLGGLIAFPGTVAVDAVATLGAEYAPGSVDSSVKLKRLS